MTTEQEQPSYIIKFHGGANGVSRDTLLRALTTAKAFATVRYDARVYRRARDGAPVAMIDNDGHIYIADGATHDEISIIEAWKTLQ